MVEQSGTVVASLKPSLLPSPNVGLCLVDAVKKLFEKAYTAAYHPAMVRPYHHTHTHTHSQ